jgi:membrane-associated phospholipid phosphatase
MKTFWPYYITHLGAASLIVPLLLLSSCALLSYAQTRTLRVWWLSLSLATVIVLASKIAFIGWGLGIARLNFTGISGHAILASATYPFVLAWLFASPTQKFNKLGLVLGLILSIVIAWSRIAVGAHSLSEVLTGLLLGWSVSFYACLQLKHQEKTLPLWFYPVFL